MQYTNPITDQELGVVAYWWRPRLNLLERGGEVITRDLQLPRHKLQQHKWTDIILIRNVPFLVQSFKETLPYNGYVTTELRRIG